MDHNDYHDDGDFFKVMSKLVARTVPGKLLFVGEILGGGKDFKPKMDELVIDIVLDIIIVIIIVIMVMVIFVREILGGGKDFKPNGHCYHQHPH